MFLPFLAIKQIIFNKCLAIFYSKIKPVAQFESYTSTNCS